VSNGNTKSTQEEVKHPNHYKMVISPLDFILENRLEFCQANIVKYASRAGRKGGKQDAISDCRKIIAYAERLITEFEGED